VFVTPNPLTDDAAFCDPSIKTIHILRKAQLLIPENQSGDDADRFCSLINTPKSFGHRSKHIPSLLTSLQLLPQQA
jgi:hypothetical protein